MLCGRSASTVPVLLGDVVGALAVALDADREITGQRLSADDARQSLEAPTAMIRRQRQAETRTNPVRLSGCDCVS